MSGGVPAIVQGVPVVTTPATVVRPAAAQQPWVPPLSTNDSTVVGLLQAKYRVGEITGITIHVHVALPAFWLLSTLFGAFRAGVMGLLLDALVYGPFLWASVLLHELCHCWAARKQGQRVDSVLLWPLGGLAYVGRASNPCVDLRTAAAGPASHVPQVAFWWGLVAASSDGFGKLLCTENLALNATMFFFNLLLPCWPLDGGRILADLLLLRKLPPEHAAVVLVRCSCVVIGLISIYALFLFVAGGTGFAMAVVMVCWLGFQVCIVRVTWPCSQAHVGSNATNIPLLRRLHADEAAAHAGPGRTHEYAPTLRNCRRGQLKSIAATTTSGPGARPPLRGRACRRRGSTRVEQRVR